MAHRSLWAVAPFSEALGGRQFADSTLIVAMLNCGARVAVPRNVHVLHLSHLHPHPRRDERTREMWRKSTFNAMPHFSMQPMAWNASAGMAEEWRIIDTKRVVWAVPAACKVATPRMDANAKRFVFGARE